MLSTDQLRLNEKAQQITSVLRQAGFRGLLKFLFFNLVLCYPKVYGFKSASSPSTDTLANIVTNRF